MGAPPDPTACISYVPELLRPKAKQQETLSPEVLGKLRHKNLCFYIRNEDTEQEKIKYPRMSSNLHWQEVDTLGTAHLWDEMEQATQEKHPLDKQSCKGRLTAPVLEGFQKRQQSKGTFSLAKFLIKPWQFTAAGRLKEKQDLKLICRRVQCLRE